MENLPFDGRSTVRLLCEVTSNQSAFIPDTVWPIPYAGDTLFFNSRGGYSLAFISDPVPLADYLGIIDHKEVNKAARNHFTERPATDIWNGRTDHEKYGSLIGDILSLSRKGEPFAHLRQKGVSHVRYVGRVSDSALVGIYRPYPNGLQIGQSARFTALQRYRPAADTATLSGVNRDGFMTFSESVTRDIGNREEANADAFASAKAEASAVSSSSFEYGYGYWRTSYEDVVDNSTKDGNFHSVDISYRYVMRYAPWIPGFEGVYEARFRVHIQFEALFVPVFGHSLASAGNRVPSECFVLWDNSSVSIESFTGSNGSYASVGEGWSINRSNDLPFFTDVLNVGDDYSDRVTSFLTMDGRFPSTRHHRFRDNVEKRMSDIRPSSFLAASDALDRNIQILRANNLQTLSKIGDILEFLPDLEAVSRLVAKAMSGDITAIIDLIDLLTQEILKMRFQREPLVKGAKELSDADLTKALEVLNQTRTVTVYGRFKYEFPRYEWTLGPGALRLESRAEVRVHFDISTLLAGYLTANSVGLLPTLARIWSLLPFSFVVDWFVNMSKRLHLVDNQLLYFALSIFWTLYSYKVTYVFTPEELEPYGLVSTNPDEPFGISVYIRDFSRYMPRLTESKFDFLRPTNSPDLVTVGSLLWQLFT